MSAVQVSSNASSGKALSAAADHHIVRLINMLRGGILHVNIRKRMNMDKDAKIDLPSSACLDTNTYEYLAYGLGSAGTLGFCIIQRVAMRQLLRNRQSGIPDGRCDYCTDTLSQGLVLAKKPIACPSR